MGQWLEQIFWWLIEQLSSGISYILALLPESPFAQFNYTVPENFGSFMHLFFYLIPAHQIIAHYAAILGIFLIYYALRVAMNWVKLIGN